MRLSSTFGGINSHSICLLKLQSYIDTNISGTLNILNAARELNISRVVHTSTSETYGSAQYVPIDESHPSVGQSPMQPQKLVPIRWH